MHGLANLQQGVVGDIHNVGDAAQPAQCQMALEPAGALGGANVAHIVGQIARAHIGGFHLYADAVIALGGAGVIGGGHFQGLIQQGCHLTRNA